MEGPNPCQGVGGVSIAQHGPAFVLHLPLNMLKTERSMEINMLEAEKGKWTLMLKERERRGQECWKKRSLDINALIKRESWT